MTAFSGALHHEMVLGTQLGAQRRPSVQHRGRARAIAARAGGDEPLDRRQFVLRAVSDEPRRDVMVAMEFRQRVWSAAILATT